MGDESLEYELKKVSSPDDKLTNRRKLKPYLMTDLNPISQVRSVDEGTPSPQKGADPEFNLEKEIEEIGLEKELEECAAQEGQLQIRSFDAEMN